jgi:hypothetical protein
MPIECPKVGTKSDPKMTNLSQCASTMQMKIPLKWRIEIHHAYIQHSTLQAVVERFHNF